MSRNQYFSRQSVLSFLKTRNLRWGPIQAVLILSLLCGRTKIGPDRKSLTLLLAAARFWPHADWLLEQCHRIWLAVGINGSWKRLFLAWLIALKNCREWSAVSEEKDFAFFFLFYGLLLGKYALICPLEIQKIQMVVLIFWGFASFTELM